MYARRAGTYAASQCANTEAVEHFSRALVLAPSDDPVSRFSLLLAREAVYNRLGQREAQRQDLDQLAALAETLSSEAKTKHALREASYAAVTAAFQDAIGHAERAAEFAQESDD